MKEKTPTSPSSYHEEKNMTKAEMNELNNMIDMTLHGLLIGACVMLIAGSIFFELVVKAL